MVTSTDDINAMVPSTVVIPVGITLAVYVDIEPGQKSLLIHTGGTIAVLGVTYGKFGATYMTGSTLTAAALNTAYTSGNYALLDPSKTNIVGAPRLYIGSVGATCTVFLFKGVNR